MPISDKLEVQVHRTIRKLLKDFPNDPAIAFVVKSTVEGVVRTKRIKFMVTEEDRAIIEKLVAEGRQR